MIVPSLFSLSRCHMERKAHFSLKFHDWSHSLVQDWTKPWETVSELQSDFVSPDQSSLWGQVDNVGIVQEFTSLQETLLRRAANLMHRWLWGREMQNFTSTYKFTQKYVRSQKASLPNDSLLYKSSLKRQLWLLTWKYWGDKHLEPNGHTTKWWETEINHDAVSNIRTFLCLRQRKQLLKKGEMFPYNEVGHPVKSN